MARAVAIGVVAAVVGGAAFTPQMASAYEAVEIASEVTEASGVGPDLRWGQPTAKIDSAAAPATFITDGDYAHVSKSDPATASAHGWWIKVTTKATRAVVRIWLQVKVGSKWKTVGSDRKTLKSGGGSGRRATARMRCAAGPIVKRPVYRSVIDVDLVGVRDDPRRAVTDSRALRCLPSR